MLLDEIEKIDLIESSNVEMKARLNRDDSQEWLKTVAGFANARGGVLYIGVEDKSNKLIGFDREGADSERNYFNNEVNQHIVPVPEMKISFIPYENNGRGLFVIKVEVMGSKLKPVTLKYRGMIGIYMRREGFTNGATVEEIIDMATKSKQAQYDSLVSDIDYRREDFGKLQRLYSENNDGRELSDKILQSCNFFTDEKKLRNGAVLFSDSYDGDKTLVKCSLFTGFTRGSDRILSVSEFRGNILDSIDFMLGFVRLRMNHTIIKKKIGHETIDAYPERALAEGIINAVAHRDYFIDGSQIQVDMFRDRLEISSPGNLYQVGSVVKTYNLTEFISKRRNSVISGILVKCKLMEAEGTGFEKIIESYRGADRLHKPFISATSDHFKLVLPDLTYDNGIEAVSMLPPVDFVPLELKSKYDEGILTLCSYGAKSAAEIAEFIGVKPSSYFRASILEPLIQKGYLNVLEGRKPVLYKTSPDIINEKEYDS